MEIKKAKKLSGSLSIPGDKSISHRAVMFGSLAEGTTRISNFLEGADCLSTISCFRKMGINIENTKGEILVHGKGLHGLSAPAETLDVATAVLPPASSPESWQDRILYQNLPAMLPSRNAL